jgi:CheY-like chemotaxis protein
MDDRLKVLVVDDKLIVADVFKFTLGYAGHDVVCVTSAEEAIILVKNQPFDIAFLDVIMPKTDGVVLLGLIREIVPNLPVVMMSGYAVDDKIKELGLTAYLRKPFELEEILTVIKEALGRDV